MCKALTEKTTIQVSKATRDRLRSLGVKGVSFDQIITALLNHSDVNDVMDQVYMMKEEKEAELVSVPEKEPKKLSVDFEKIFFDTMNEVADVLEKPPAVRIVEIKKLKKVGRARLRDRILHAETWPERDRLLRGLAAKCYNIAQKYAKMGDEDAMNQSLKWMKLTARFLGLGFTPKRLEDLEEIKKGMEQLEAQMRELEDVEDGEG